MGVFAWFRRRGQDVDDAAARSARPVPREAAGDAEAVGIPKQTAAAEAADSEAGEGARP